MIVYSIPFSLQNLTLYYSHDLNFFTDLKRNPFFVFSYFSFFGNETLCKKPIFCFDSEMIGPENIIICLYNSIKSEEYVGRYQSNRETGEGR